jgi:hypothetical protein
VVKLGGAWEIKDWHSTKSQLVEDRQEQASIRGGKASTAAIKQPNVPGLYDSLKPQYLRS